MAKICFYCGNELKSGEKCSCRVYSAESNKKDNSAGKSSGSDRTKKQYDKEKKARERRKYRQEKARKSGSGFNKSHSNGSGPGAWQTRGSSILSFFYRFMTNQGFSKDSPLHRKVGYSFVQTLLRPIAAIDAFVLNKDFTVSVSYLLIFSLSAGLAFMRILPGGISVFAEGMLMSILLISILTGLLILSFRLFAKIRYTFRDMLSVFSAPFVYLSLFFLIASAGRINIFSFAATIVAGIMSGTLLHFISLKKFSILDYDRLLVNLILVYFVFLSVCGLIFSLAISPSDLLPG